MEKQYITLKDGKKRLATEIECGYCGKMFLKSNIEIRRTKRRGFNNNYCSHDCSCKSRRNRIKVKCCQCGKKFETIPKRLKASKSGLLFCSVECKNMGQRIENCHSDMLPSHYNNGKTTYREMAFRNYPHKCAECGYDEVIGILEVHHIDSDRNNNVLDNLIILCPNHHRMLTLGLATLNEDKKICII